MPQMMIIQPFFKNLSPKIEDLSNENQIIGGYFNLVLNIDMDKRGGRQTTNFKSQEVRRNWCEQTDLRLHLEITASSGSNFHLVKKKQTTKIVCHLDFSGFICFSRRGQQFWNVIWVTTPTTLPLDSPLWYMKIKEGQDTGNLTATLSMT